MDDDTGEHPRAGARTFVVSGEQELFFPFLVEVGPLCLLLEAIPRRGMAFKPLTSAGAAFVGTSFGRTSTEAPPFQLLLHECISPLVFAVVAGMLLTTPPVPLTSIGTSALHEEDTVDDWMIC